MENNNLSQNKFDLSLYTESFAKKAMDSRGESHNCYCITCGHPISLHEKMSGGYCDKCGDYVSLELALSCALSEEAIMRMDEFHLYNIEKKLGAIPSVRTLKRLAKKGHIPSAHLLAHHYFKNKKYKECYEFTKEYVDLGTGDIAFYLSASLGRMGELDTTDCVMLALESMSQIKSNNTLRMPASERIFEKEYAYIQECYKEAYAREARLTSYSSISDYSSGSSSSTGISDKDWDDFTFMNGIIDRMHNDPAWGDDTRVSNYDPYSKDMESFPSSSEIW